VSLIRPPSWILFFGGLGRGKILPREQAGEGVSVVYFSKEKSCGVGVRNTQIAKVKKDAS